MKEILNENQVAKTIDKLYTSINKALPDNIPIAIMGVRTRGETIAGRLVERLQADHPEKNIQHGILDITFYRDDLSRRCGVPVVKATEIDFDIDDCWVVLVDDVLHTGRSVRAALDALHDFGRPKFIKLAVLIDRGGHELPIAADFCGKKFKDIANNDRIQLRLKENDGQEGAHIIKQKG